MTEIEKLYEKYCNEKSDINEHLPSLKKYAIECEHVTEMGVRWAVSTCALITAKPRKLISYDITDKFFNTKDILIKNSELLGVDFNFIIGDTLKVNIEKTDMLFIDTLHTYNQLYTELMLHSNNVQKYIILHDTTLYGFKDEDIYNHASDIVKNTVKNKEGLYYAMMDFFQTENGNNWYIYEKFSNNNGLTILKRKLHLHGKL